MMHSTSRKWLYWISLLLGISLMVGCASNNTQSIKPFPDWINQPPKDNRYLYGVGSAETMQDIATSFGIATKQANADIANQLRTSIQSVNTQNTQVTQSSRQQEQVYKSFSSIVRVETSPIVLESAETAERFQNDHYTYVLQKLDRLKVSQKLQQQRDDIDKKLLMIHNEVESGQEIKYQWRTLFPALSLLSERRRLNEAWSLYANAAAAPASSFLPILETYTSELLTTFIIDIKEKNPNNGLSQAVASGLTQKGLTASIQSQSNHQVRLFITTLYDHQKQADRHYIFANTNAVLSDAQDNQLASWSVVSRGISAIEEQSKTLANQQISQDLSEKIFEWFTIPIIKKATRK